MADLKGYSQLQARLKAVGSSGTGMMQMLGLSVVREAKLIVPRKTGNLGRSIHLRSHSATQATVEASANYAAFVEFGTRAHEITPRVKLALAWAPGVAGGKFRRLTGSTRRGVGSGDMTFAKRVSHPGTKANPFLEDGAKKAVAGSGLKDIIVKAWNGAA
jgi:hypothetical protein